MAILARDFITIAYIKDIVSVTWYYKLQATTASVPAKPTTNPPSSDWSTTEPEYTAGSTSSLYVCQKTVYTDDSFSYSDVSLSSSYEAAKQAYNKSVAAQTAADSAMESIDNLEIGGRNLLLDTGVETTLINEYTDYWQSSDFGKSLLTNTEDSFVVSFDYEVTGDFSGLSPTPDIYMQCESTSIGGYIDITEEISAHHEHSFHLTSGQASNANKRFRLRFRNRPENVTCTFRNLKIERGTKATTWTPAPEDIQNDIDSAKTKVTELISDGANLMIGTTYPDASSAETLPRIFGQPDVTHVRSGSILSTAEHGFRVTNSGTGYTYILFGDTANTGTHQGLNGLIPGETYTLSCDVTCKILSNNTNTTTYYLRVNYFDDHVTTGTFAQSKTKNLLSITKNDRGVEKSTTERAFFTFKVEEGTTKLYLAIYATRTTQAEYAAGDFIELRNLKLEKGSVATPWSSPADWNSKIIAAANGRNKNSYITKSSDGDFDFPSGAVEGDQCFVAEYGSTVYTTLYRFNGTNWVDTKIGGMAVTQLDAGNIVTGTLDATKVSMKQLAMYPDGVDTTNPANASFFVDTTPYNATTNPYGGKFFWNMRNSSLSKEGKLALISWAADYIHDDDGNINVDAIPALLVSLTKLISPSVTRVSKVEIDGSVVRLIVHDISASVSIYTDDVIEISPQNGIQFYEELNTLNQITGEREVTRTLKATITWEMAKRLTNEIFVGAWTRSDVGAEPNYDAPGFNGVFEVRPTSETPYETGEKPTNGYYPMFTATGGFASLQLAGESVGGKLYWRGNQSGNKNLSGVSWRTILDSETKPTTGTVTSSHTIQYQRAVKDALGNVDLYLRIALKSATSAWATIATLPSGYYPKETLRITMVNGSTVTIGAIANSGAVQLGTAGTSGAVIYVQCHYNNI